MKSDAVLCFGTQSGKTASIMGGVAWKVENDPERFLWVMPTRDKCGEFSRTRWMKMVRASEIFRDRIPTGALRHSFSTFHQALGSSLIDMAWSNSPTALSSNPCGVVVLDEVDKFPSGKREADPVSLAEQRTKNSATPKRCKTSTPTMSDGPIWQEFLKTDQRRWFVPCPHCSKHIVLIWSKNFTVFKSTGCEAHIRWDDLARNKDGTWDLDAVEASARAECPHCGGHIRDGHKTAMNRAGEWRPTAQAARGFMGWHLPSLYSISPECNFGRLSRKFLQDKASLTGLQDFINSDLAEPYESQDTRGERKEMISERIEITAEWRKLMSADTQKDGFWFVCRAISGKKSVGFDAGFVQTWDELRTKQESHEILDTGVIVDSGWGTKSDDGVYRNCARWCQIHTLPQRKPYLLGWTPAKGFPGRKRWKDENGVLRPYFLRKIDPYDGTSDAQRVEMGLFEFAGDSFKDILAELRTGKGSFQWSVEPQVGTEEYFRHLDGEHKVRIWDKSRRVEERWMKRSRDWPNHWLDCEVMALAYGAYLEIIQLS